MTQTFRLGNFNVRNLVPKSTSEQYHFFYRMNRRNSYLDQGEGSDNRYQTKIDWISQQLDVMDCDIITFQEVFDLEPLQEAVDRSSYAGTSSLYIAGELIVEDEQYKGQPAKVYRQPRIALLVRDGFEVTAMESLSNFPEDFGFNKEITDSGRTWKLNLLEDGQALNEFARPILKATIRMSSRFSAVKKMVDTKGLPEITVFSAHFKSKRPIKPDPELITDRQGVAEYLKEQAIGASRSLLLRGLEAAALRSYVVDELSDKPQTPIVLMGDLNDGARSVTSEVAGGLTSPIFSSEVEPDREARDQLFEMAADMAMYSVYDLQTQRTHRDIYYTHIFNGFHDILDHVFVTSHFVSKWLRDGRGSRPIGKVGTLRVLNDHLVNADVDDMQSHKVGKYLHTRSDHGQVVVRLDWFE